MAIDTTDGKNELAACRIGKDMISHSPSTSSEIDKIPIMNARSHLMKHIAKELQPKVTTKGVCFIGMYAWTIPKYQHMGLSQILLELALK